MKELYSFEVKVKDGDKPTKVILKKPTQRELEDGEVEFSVALSHFIRKGIMTKHMLHKQFADVGGLLPEKVAKEQNDRYTELYDTQHDLVKISALPKEQQDKKKQDKLLNRFVELKREIGAVEQIYNQAYNHTAERKAENRLAMWWFFKILNIKRDEDSEPFRFFGSETYEENQDKFHKLYEGEDELFKSFSERAMGIVSFWLNSENPTAEQIKEFDDTLVEVLEKEKKEESEITDIPEEGLKDEVADKEFSEKDPKPKVKVSKPKALTKKALKEAGD